MRTEDQQHVNLSTILSEPRLYHLGSPVTVSVNFIGRQSLWTVGC